MCNTNLNSVAYMLGVTAAVIGLPLDAAVQVTQPAPAIIACEGPNMPSACPLGPNAPKTMDDARHDLAERQAAEAQQLQLARQRIGLNQQFDQNRIVSAKRSQAAQPLSPLSPPNFSAAVQLLSGMGNGDPE